MEWEGCLDLMDPLQSRGSGEGEGRMGVTNLHIPRCWLVGELCSSARSPTLGQEGRETATMW